MNNNMIIPGLKDVIIHEIKEYLDRVAIHVSLAKIVTSVFQKWNQVARIHSVKAKTFKEAADVLGTSLSIIIRRFKGLIKTMPNGVQLPEVIAIDEYKVDTDAGKYQLNIANAETHEPIVILSNRHKEPIHHYLS